MDCQSAGRSHRCSTADQSTHRLTDIFAMEALPALTLYEYLSSNTKKHESDLKKQNLDILTGGKNSHTPT